MKENTARIGDTMTGLYLKDFRVVGRKSKNLKHNINKKI